MLESLASLVSLRVLLLVDLPLDHFVRHLGRNLNVVTDKQRDLCPQNFTSSQCLPDQCTGILLVQLEVV